MFEITKANDIAILHLYGEIAQLEMELIQKIIHSFKCHDQNKILLDLARVDHVHFEAVKKWAEEARELRNRQGDLKLIRPSPNTREILKFTGVDQHLQDYASVSEAILSFLKYSEQGFTPGSLKNYPPEMAGRMKSGASFH